MVSKIKAVVKLPITYMVKIKLRKYDKNMKSRDEFVIFLWNIPNAFLKANNADKLSSTNDIHIFDKSKVKY